MTICSDIIQHYLIPNAPVEFLCAAAWTRKLAINCLGKMRVGCNTVDYARIIKTLSNAGNFAQLAEFMAVNFDKKLFDVAILTRVINEDHFRYHKWYPRVIQDVALSVAMGRIDILDIGVIAGYLDARYFNTDANLLIEEPIESYFFHNDEMVFDGDAWDQTMAERLVDFTLARFPHICIDYLDVIIEEGFAFEPYNLRLVNGSLKCLELVLKKSIFRYDTELLPMFWRYIWRYRMCDVCFELREELYGEIKHKSPLFARLRRRTSTRMDNYRRFMALRWQLSTKIGAPVSIIPPSNWLYLTLHLDDTDDEEFSDYSNDSDDDIDIDTNDTNDINTN